MPSYTSKEFVEAFENTIAPMTAADLSWDNVGIILDTSERNLKISKILLCIDLSMSVVDEAIEKKCQLILAYHPSIFGNGLKNINHVNPMQSCLLKCARNSIGIFSPHTALDNMSGGINDFLNTAFENPLPEMLKPEKMSSPTLKKPKQVVSGIQTVENIETKSEDVGVGKIVTLVSEVSVDSVVQRIKEFLNLKHLRVAVPEGVKTIKLVISFKQLR